MKRLVTMVSMMIVLLFFIVNGSYAQGHVDPPYLLIQSTEHPITVDGKLDETDWQRRFDHLVYRANFTPGDVEYAVTGGELVKGDYPDTTSTIVKILHHGLDLYISLQSDDHSVCRFGDSWEGDGLFMKIKDAGGTDVEYKLYFNLAGADPDIHYEEPGLYPGSGSGAAYKFPGTVVNDTTQVDSGYTAELVIHLDQLGYTDPYADIPVMINIFDPDGYHDGTPAWGDIGSYHKLWWGSQWGPDMRILKLGDPPSKIAIKTEEALLLDGQLNESFWLNADSVVVAKGSNLSTAGYYQQWGDPLNSYTDQSAAVIKFVHKGTDLYVGVQSNDASVCKWSPGWEADGLFLWMTYKGQIPQPGERLEIKAMYFDATEGASISFETNANVPTGAAEAVSFEPTGTVTHTETNGADVGYSIELLIHTDMFGYSDLDTVKLGTVIWDLDYASADAYDPVVADYAPNWWGTQWADANFEKYYMYRDVILSDQETIGEPAISVDLTSIDFGEVVVNDYKDALVAITNTGNGVLSISSITSDNAVFTVDKTAFTVQPGASVNLEVTFKPTAVETYSGTLTISSNAGDVTISLTGKGKEGVIVKKPGHTDPPYLLIQSAEKQIMIDGKLDETDWQRRFDHLVFRSNFKPGDVEYAVTGEVEVQAPYTDTTSTVVKVLHHGLDLYISLNSDDHSVCKFNGSWEGDGLFMKIADASGAQVEYKLFFNHDGQDPDIHFEYPALYPGSGEGAAWKRPGTIVNDNTAPDSGYTAEMVIHLDQLGYTDPYADIPVLLNIFDPDGYVGGDGWDAGAYHKTWWGSEWGPDTRILRLADPPVKNAIKTDTEITLDGQLNESFWADAEKVIVAKGSNLSSAGYYQQWGDPDNTIDDTSTAIVKFVHKGTDLYIGVQSDDKSVCKWSPGWEADGLFLWMTYKDQIPQPGERLEIKAMYFDATQGASISFETNANVPTGAAEGASYEPAGTVTHTETNGADEGYSIEVVVHTDMFGYAAGDTVKVSVCIWDLDFASADAYDPKVADYAPHWWGTQWVDANFEKYYMYRDVVLSDLTVGVKDEKPSTVAHDFQLEQNFPNPFNPTTTIQYNLPNATKVTIEVFNILGDKVATLVNEKQLAGTYSIEWDGKDASGRSVGSDIYFYKISTKDFSATKKMLLMK
jgi:hypothetical protein